MRLHCLVIRCRCCRSPGYPLRLLPYLYIDRLLFAIRNISTGQDLTCIGCILRKKLNFSLLASVQLSLAPLSKSFCLYLDTSCTWHHYRSDSIEAVWCRFLAVFDRQRHVAGVSSFATSVFSDDLDLVRSCGKS